MGELKKMCNALCDKCKYSMYLNICADNQKYAVCDYIGREGKSRVFNKDGERRIPTGYCDCYVERQGKRLTGHAIKAKRDKVRRERIEEAKAIKDCKDCPHNKKNFERYGVTLNKDTCVFTCKYDRKES